MRFSISAIALSILVVGCSPETNSGLSGVDYSLVETTTLSGDILLKPDTLVQSTTRRVGNGRVYFESSRSSDQGTGLTTATWTNVQGIYLTEAEVFSWAASRPQSEPHLSPEIASALVRCAPQLGSYPSFPIAAARAGRFGRVVVGDRTYFQYLLSASKWRTELDQVPGGGGRNVRILPEVIEVFGSVLPISASDTLEVDLDIEYKFSSGTAASYALRSSAIHLNDVQASCTPNGELQITGGTSRPAPSGWMAITRDSYNLTTRWTERRNR